tara:strand:- start:38 stop:226 length:189 start_codon:yes stop_codon:yes gene_type:complete
MAFFDTCFSERRSRQVRKCIGTARERGLCRVTAALPGVDAVQHRPIADAALMSLTFSRLPWR